MKENWKKILFLAIPSIASFASMTVTSTIHLMIIGQLGALAIAVVGVSNIIMYNAWALFSGIGHTVNYLVAQNFGANQLNKGIERTYLALYLCIAASVLVILCGTFLSDGILLLMSGSEELVRTGGDYLRVRFFAMVFAVFSFVFHGFFRGIGDTKTPMRLSVISNLCMIICTYTFTRQWGLAGAGWAFLIGEAVGALGCLYVYFVSLHARFGTRTKVPFNRSESKLILSESFKLGIQEFSMSVSMFIFTMFVARLGTHALAANEIALNVMAFGFMPAFAFGTTATILVGQEIGKGNPLLARRAGTDTAIMGSLFMLLLGLVEFLLADPIARLYTDDPQVYELTASLIKTSAFLQVFDGLLNFYAGGLRGIGDTTFLLRVSFLLGFFFFVPLTYVLTFVLQLSSMGAWLSLYIFLMAFGISVMIRFYRTDWSQVRLKSAQPVREQLAE
ncbi:MATE family efflux transporter [Lihuaxuella thermophila]|uniref:Probable multidrug resistance protein NorM n=1 Tax=Lihuaxuella thermophila TaxID=1173111 RepID=A0A1H8D173_9BACL|nr:MATE family efflux transporter [Lihuaxuella thermophila]SEN00932.1 putative efflux protein, MATE family [Lihuaxuella thermophila]